MSAFIKIASGRNRKYLGFLAREGVELVDGPGHSVEIKGDVEVATVTPSVFKIKLGVLRPEKYEVVLTAAPELHDVGIVSHPIVYAPGVGEEVIIYLRAHKKIDDVAVFSDFLSTLPCVARMYLID